MYLDNVNLGPFMFYPSLSDANYQLEALVVHYGESGFGHYFTLRKVDGVWYEVGFEIPFVVLIKFLSAMIVLCGKYKVKAD